MTSGCVALASVVARLQTELEEAVARDYPIGAEVTFPGKGWLRVGIITGHRGEVVKVGNVWRHWTKIQRVLPLKVATR